MKYVIWIIHCKGPFRLVTASNPSHHFTMAKPPTNVLWIIHCKCPFRLVTASDPSHSHIMVNMLATVLWILHRKCPFRLVTASEPSHSYMQLLTGFLNSNWNESACSYRTPSFKPGIFAVSRKCSPYTKCHSKLFLCSWTHSQEEAINVINVKCGNNTTQAKLKDLGIS